MKKDQYWGPLSVNLTIIWRCLLGAFELIDIFVCKEKELQ